MTDTNPTNPLGSFAQSVTTAIIRKGMGIAAGYLLAHGFLAQTQTGQFTEIGASILLGGVSLAWSIYQKHVAHKAIDTAQAK